MGLLFNRAFQKVRDRRLEQLRSEFRQEARRQAPGQVYETLLRNYTLSPVRVQWEEVRFFPTEELIKPGTEVPDTGEEPAHPQFVPRLRVTIPYKGDGSQFDWRPSRFDPAIQIRGDIVNCKIVFEYWGSRVEGREAYEGDRHRMQLALEALELDFQEYNQTVRAQLDRMNARSTVLLVSAAQDAVYAKEFGTFLQEWRTQGLIGGWGSRVISSRPRLDLDVHGLYQNFSYIVVLVSPSLLEADYDNSAEFYVLEELRPQPNRVCIVVSDCVWQERLPGFFALREDHRPLATWPSRAKAVQDTASRLLDLLSAGARS